MQTAKMANTTPTRRSAMRFSLAALTAGLTVPALAASDTSPDTNLINLCDRLIAVETEECLLVAHDECAPDYGPNHARYNELIGERERLEGLIEDCEPPANAAGFASVARAALTWVPRDSDGGTQSQDLGGSLLVMLAEGVGAGFMWPPRPGSCSTANWAPPTSPQEIAGHRAAHDARMASIEAQIKADQEAREAEQRRLDDPANMTDADLQERTEGAREIAAAAGMVAAPLEAEMARRGLA